jgi:hypothetical protein
MDGNSLQEALPNPDLPAFLDGLPEAWFSNSPRGLVTFHLQHMVWFLRLHLLATVLLHIKTIHYDCNKLCMFRWTAMPCRASSKLSVVVNNSGMLPATAIL